MQATDRTVYVGNVGKEVDDAALLALFGHCGTVSGTTAHSPWPPAGCQQGLSGNASAPCRSHRSG